MKMHEKELFDLLHETGKIGRLRKRLVALLLCIEDIHENMKENDEEDEEISFLVKKIERTLSEFATSQRLADRMIIGLTPQERKAFIKEIPDLLDIFGWRNKFDEDGSIRDVS